MTIIELLSNGWIGVIASALVMIVSGIYINRRAKSQAEKVAHEAYEGAIAAMQAHIHALQMRMDDTEIENKHLKEIMEKIFDLLSARDIHIMVQGHTVSIREGKETRIIRTGEIDT